MRAKKILLTIPEMSTGGAQRSLAKLSLELVKQHEVWLAVFNTNHTVAYPIGGKLISLNIIPGKSWISKINALYNRIAKLKILKKQLQIDISISFLEGADYVNILSKGSEKVIISIRGSKLHDENMHRYFFWLRSRILVPWLYKKADLIVTVSKGIEKELKHYFKIPGTKILTIPNFYDRKEIEELSSEKRPEGLAAVYSKKVLITTGRLAVEKGIDFLLQIFARVKKMNKETIFIIVGDGLERKHLLDLCRTLKLVSAESTAPPDNADVIFTGDQRNVFKYLRGASIYLMNSSSEGFPNGLLEAMICGVPVMSSNCAYGPAEILAPELNDAAWNDQPYVSKFGILMPRAENDRHLDLWAENILRLLDNLSLQVSLSKAGRERVGDFDKDKTLNSWLATFNE